MKLREVLWWCAPAFVVAFVLRALLSTAMPFAYVQHDSSRLLIAPEAWFVVGPTDTFSDTVPPLVPSLCRLAQRGPIPALVAIQLVQHALGLLQVLIAGALVRLWFVRWKWWIIPATILFAVHPSFLWFEHTVMLETAYVFALMLLALAGTWLLRAPSLPAAGVVCGALLLVAFTRPEGKLFAAFGALALVVAFWKDWRSLAASAAIFAATLAGIALGTVPGESGLLLYSSVLHLSPETPRKFPEVAPYVATLRREAIESAKQGPAFVSRPQREALEAVLGRYVQEHPGAGRGENISRRVNAVAKSLAFETCLRAPWSLVPLAAQKFRATADELANGRLNGAWLHERQISRLSAAWIYVQPIAPGLYGRAFTDRDGMAAFIKASFPPGRVAWFEWLHEAWGEFYDRRLPDTRFQGDRLHGLPWVYLIALAGATAAVLRALPTRRFQVCWVLMLGGLWFVVMVTANERARFRMGFEPFVFLYLLVALDEVATVVARISRGLRSRLSRS
ncbi:MAG: hypothetical protein ABMA13_12065 [Chthoniobacteraceae bacterium]